MGVMLGPCPPAKKEFSGLQPETGKKKGRILALSSPRELEKISRKIWQCPENPMFEQFPILRLIISYFLGETKTNIFLFFSYFGPEARKHLLASGQGRKRNDFEKSVVLYITNIRGPQMGGQIRRGRIWRFWGAPIFSPEIPKYLF